MAFRTEIDTRGMGVAFDRYAAFAEARVQKALLAATDRGAQRLKSSVRSGMQSAGLGRLGQAFDMRSDQQRGRGVHQTADGVSASGIVYVRSRSERTRGALQSYTEGANIAPRRGRFLWIPTDEVQRLVGKGKSRQRLTPGNWRSSGMEARLGPLIPLKNVNGYPMLAVQRVGTSIDGRKRSARSLTKSGRARKGQRIRELLIVFTAIPNTARAARIDLRAEHARAMAELPAILTQELRRA